MVADFGESSMLSELQYLEEEIAAVDWSNMQIGHTAQRHAALSRLLVKLGREKERLKIRLLQHRQRRAESGVKY